MARKKSRKRTDERREEKLWYQQRREGFFLYAALWKILRTVLIYLSALIIVIGLVYTGGSRLRDYFLAPMDAKDGNWVRYVLNGGDAVLSYRAPTNNPNDAANFDRDADMLLGFLLENSGEQVSGEPAQAQVEETVDGARIAFTEFACADGQQGSAAMIFDPVSGVLHGVVMTVAGGIDSGIAPDFPAFVRSLNTADIDSLFATPEG